MSEPPYDKPDGELDKPRSMGTIQTPRTPPLTSIIPNVVRTKVSPPEALQATLPATSPVALNERFKRGERVIENFIADKKLGEGGFGEVWRIKHYENDLYHALKILSATDPVSRERFKQEIKLLTEIKHDNVVRVFNSGELRDGSLYYTMEWLNGNDLEREIRTKYRGRPPPWSVTREIILQICDGLGALHRKRIVHRDLKPQNCMDDTDPRADDVRVSWKIVDLGIAKRLALDGLNPRGRSYEAGINAPRRGTLTGSFIGTLDYASPEQLSGNSATISYRSDIYSLGIILYEMLTGQVPHPSTLIEETDPDGLKHRRLRIEAIRPDPPSTRAAVGAFPPAIDDVVLRALEFDPDRRYRTAGEFADAIQHVSTPNSKRPVHQAAIAGPARIATRVDVAAAIAIARESTREPAPLRAPLSSPADPSENASPPPIKPEPVGEKTSETNKYSSLTLLGILGAAMTVALVVIVSLNQGVFDRKPAPAPKGEPTTTTTLVMPTEEFNQAHAAIRSLGLKETNKAQTALQKIIDDPRRPLAVVAQAKQLLAELLLERALACQIAVSLEPSAMSGEAHARSTEDPPAARELLDNLGADAQGRITTLEALVVGQSPAVAADDAELSALALAAPLWRGQLRNPSPGLISTLQRLPNPSTLSQSVLALALVRSGDEIDAREQLLVILKTVPDQPVARTLLDLLDRQGMMTAGGDPEPVPTLPSEPAPVEPGKTRTAGASAPPGSAAVEAMISTGCQKIRAGDPEGIKLLLAAIERGVRPRDNFNLCFCLGNGFARQNAHDTAFSWYSRAVEQSPTNRDAVAGAARSAELQGNTAKAVEYYKKLRALEPTNPTANAYIHKHDHTAGTPDTGDVPPELMGVPTRKKTP